LGFGVGVVLALLYVFVVGVLNGAYPLVSSIRRLARGQYNLFGETFVNLFIKLLHKSKGRGAIFNFLPNSPNFGDQTNFVFAHQN
jgi:hypothetical protein